MKNLYYVFQSVSIRIVITPSNLMPFQYIISQYRKQVYLNAVYSLDFGMCQRLSIEKVSQINFGLCVWHIAIKWNR
jgi:hypothetical protein